MSEVVISETFPKCTHMFENYAVIGRIPFDDEDTCFCYSGVTHEEAERRFIADLYETSDRKDQEKVEAENGSPVIITCFLASESPIQET